MTYPPTGDPNDGQYYGGYPAPPGPPPTGAFPAPPGPSQPVSPGYPPQYGPPQYPQQPAGYPQQQPAGYPPQPPPTQSWQQAPATQGRQQPPTPPQGWQPPPPAQGWQPPPAPMPGAPRGSTPWPLIGVVAGVLVLAVIGGVLVVTKLVGNDDPVAPVTADGDPTKATTTGPAAPGLPTDRPLKTSSAPAGPGKYSAAGDLCSMDLTALGIYASKKEKATPNVRNTGGIARSDCDFDLRTSSGMKVTFGIKTQVYTTTKEAKQYFDSGYDLDKSRYFDADLTGLGERSYGTNRDWDIGSKTSDYTIRVVDSNLYLSVSLVTFGTAFVPKDQLKPKTIDEVKTILGKLPTA
ncbi:hypothetical protein ABT369_24220 [Dactylosporangium sp. NPDC000244]|uniref:hypothetical protein n=1 Tax=Dactylosporangium sp. NPDC000244 TaxID=3154365 RepID=UPI003326D509